MQPSEFKLKASFMTPRIGSFLGLAGACARFAADVHELRNPKPYVELRTGEEHRETRPWSDVLLHVIIFRWIRRFVGDGWLFQQVLCRLNQKVLDWDVPFERLGKDPATEAEVQRQLQEFMNQHKTETVNLRQQEIGHSTHIYQEVIGRSTHIYQEVIGRSTHSYLEVIGHSTHIYQEVIGRSTHIYQEVIGRSTHIYLEVIGHSTHIYQEVIGRSTHIYQ
eukprot:s4664_g1.t1